MRFRQLYWGLHYGLQIVTKLQADHFAIEFYAHSTSPRDHHLKSQADCSRHKCTLEARVAMETTFKHGLLSTIHFIIRFPGIANHLPQLPFLCEFATEYTQITDQILACLHESLSGRERAVCLDAEDELPGDVSIEHS